MEVPVVMRANWHRQRSNWNMSGYQCRMLLCDSSAIASRKRENEKHGNDNYVNENHGSESHGNENVRMSNMYKRGY